MQTTPYARLGAGLYLRGAIIISLPLGRSPVGCELPYGHHEISSDSRAMGEPRSDRTTQPLACRLPFTLREASVSRLLESPAQALRNVASPPGSTPVPTLPSVIGLKTGDFRS